MVSLKSVEKQLKRIRFNQFAWGRAEVHELPNILMPDETIFELVNGTYEGGFALLCATDLRLLLVDKKPFKFLTVEDMRFDMINQIDYSHRMFGAKISISAGAKMLKFSSYNQERLRKLIGHVQNQMSEAKKEQSDSAQTQQDHLERINQQLQAYLLAQYQQQEELRRQLTEAHGTSNGSPAAAPAAAVPQPIKPTAELSDYLFAQTLLEQYRKEHPDAPTTVGSPALPSTQVIQTPMAQAPQSAVQSPDSFSHEGQMKDLYDDGMKEVYGNRQSASMSTVTVDAVHATVQVPTPIVAGDAANPLEVNALRIAYSKLPMALRDRTFGHHVSSRVVAPAPSQ